MKRLAWGIYTLMLIFSLFSSSIFIVTSDWPGFHNDPAHTGATQSTVPDTPYTRWYNDLGTGNYSSPVVSQGYVIVGSNNGVYAYVQSNGTEMWNFTTNGTAVTPYIDVNVYTGTNNGTVYKFNIANGNKIWNVSVGNSVRGVTMVGGRVIVSTYNGSLYAIGDVSGSSLWNKALNGSISTVPAYYNGVIYIGTGNGYLYAINENDGNELWNYSISPSGVTTSPVIASGLVFFGSNNTYIYAVNISTTTLEWRNNTFGPIYSTPVVSGDRVYIGSDDYRFYAFDIVNGTTLWKYTTNGAIGTSSPGIGGNGRIVFGGVDGRVYCLKAQKGELLWSFLLGGSVSSPAISDGYVYVSGGRYLYALGNYLPVVSPLVKNFVQPNVTVEFNVSAYDSDGMVVLYEWDFDGDGVYDWNNTTHGNATYKFTVSGPYNPVLRVTDDSNESTFIVLSIRVNTPPGKPAVTITPSKPKSNEDITCNASATDVDGEPVTYTYQWYVGNGSTPAYTGKVLSLSLTKRGEKWRCLAIPSDGNLTGESGMAEVTILNSIPEIINVSIYPAKAYTNTTLTTDVNWTDFDADPQLVFEYIWYVNGENVDVPSTQSYLSGRFRRGNVVFVAVRGSDGTDWSDWVESNNITISNAPPIKPEITILPEKPSRNDDLNINFVERATDPDNDPVRYRYAWYKDDVFQPGFQNTTVLASDANLKKGQVWKCVVTPYDDFISGESAEASVTIQNTPPIAKMSDEIYEVNIYLKESGIFHGTGIDEDGDPLIHEWDFQNDGIFDWSSNENGNGVYSSDVYISPGSYTAVYRVTDDSGAMHTVSVKVKVINKLPIAEIIMEKGPYTVGKNIAFDASNSRDPDGVINNYKWEFGDGTEVSGEGLVKVTHRYISPGSYIVRLTVSDKFDGTGNTTVDFVVESVGITPEPTVPTDVSTLLLIVAVILGSIFAGFFIFMRYTKGKEEPAPITPEIKDEKIGLTTDEVKSLYYKDALDGYDKYKEKEKKVWGELEELKKKVQISSRDEIPGLVSPSETHAIPGLTVARRRRVSDTTLGDTSLSEAEILMGELTPQAKDALRIVAKVRPKMVEVRKMGLDISSAENLLLRAQNAIESESFETASRLARKAEHLILDMEERAKADKARGVVYEGVPAGVTITGEVDPKFQNILDIMEPLRTKLHTMEAMGIDIVPLEALLNRSEECIEAGDYNKALEYSKEADVICRDVDAIYSRERKGETIPRCSKCDGKINEKWNVCIYCNEVLVTEWKEIAVEETLVKEDELRALELIEATRDVLSELKGESYDISSAEKYIILAQSTIDRGFVEGALDYAQKALKTAEKIREEGTKLEAPVEISEEIKAMEGQARELLPSVESKMVELEREDIDTSMVYRLIDLSKNAIEKQEYDVSLRYAKKAMRLLEDMEDRAKVKGATGTSVEEEAVSKINALREKIKTLSPTRDVTMAEDLIKLADSYLRSGNFERAMSTARKVEEELKK